MNKLQPSIKNIKLDSIKFKINNTYKNKGILCIKKKEPKTLEYTTEQLKNHKQCAINAVKNNGTSLQYVHEYLKNDKNVVKAAIKQNGLSLEYASEQLKNNKNMVRLAVTKNYNSLEFASNELKNDKKIVMVPITNKVGSLKYASQILQNNKEIILSCLNTVELKHITKLFSDDIKKLLQDITTTEDAKFILQSTIEQEKLNDHIVNINNKTKLNKI